MTWCLTIDDTIQATGEGAVASTGLPGGFVAMNIHNGQLYGLGSSPSYDPATFAKPRVPQATYRNLIDEDLGAPLFDRATNGFYPTGSTFKPDHGAGGAGLRRPRPQRDHQRPR